jgi:hypothetical protein
VTIIYAFPPVASKGREWTEEVRVQRSAYLLSGKRAVSSLGPRRRLAQVQVSALARGRNGAGYSESLKRFLDGGINLVRLYSWPVNWHLDATGAGVSVPMTWTSGAVPLTWTSGAVPMRWFSGPAIRGVAGTDAGGFPILTLSGLVPGALVVRPFDVLRAYPDNGDPSVAVRAVSLVYADGSGGAVVRLHDAAVSGTVSVGDSETGVFEATAMPRAVQPVNGDWVYQWDFREVLADEITDPEEVNPW